MPITADDDATQSESAGEAEPSQVADAKNTMNDNRPLHKDQRTDKVMETSSGLLHELKKTKGGTADLENSADQHGRQHGSVGDLGGHEREGVRDTKQGKKIRGIPRLEQDEDLWRFASPGRDPVSGEMGPGV